MIKKILCIFGLAGWLNAIDVSPFLNNGSKCFNYFNDFHACFFYQKLQGYQAYIDGYLYEEDELSGKYKNDKKTLEAEKKKLYERLYNYFVNFFNKSCFNYINIDYEVLSNFGKYQLFSEYYKQLVLPLTKKQLDKICYSSNIPEAILEVLFVDADKK